MQDRGYLRTRVENHCSRQPRGGQRFTFVVPSRGGGGLGVVAPLRDPHQHVLHRVPVHIPQCQGREGDTWLDTTTPVKVQNDNTISEGEKNCVSNENSVPVIPSNRSISFHLVI